VTDEPLSRDARAMLNQALSEEQALAPDASHRRQLKRALLQGAALAGASGAATAKAASTLPLLGLGKSVGLGLLISGGVLGGAQLILAPARTPAPAASIVVAAPPRPVAPPAPPLTRASTEVEPVTAPPNMPRATPVSVPPAPSSSAPALRAELQLLNAAQAAQRDGRAAEALSLLRRYDATFPAGQLTSERLAVEVFAACALGDRAAATRAAERFLQRDASSALAERVKRACPFDQEGSPR
jgi:hypothetical protein